MQSIKWEKEVTVNLAYLTMLPIRRKDGDFLITDTAFFDGKSYDISQEGHNTALSPGCTEKVKEITISGQNSGITANVTVDFNNNFHIANPDIYNKLYFSYANNQKTSIGEVWETKSTYRFVYKNK